MTIRMLVSVALAATVPLWPARASAEDAPPAAAPPTPAPSPVRVRPKLVVDPRPQSMALLNAAVFDGQRFVPRDLFIEDGVFVSVRPTKVEREIDLSGAFIIPALADSHTHRFSGVGFDAAGARELFLLRGVLYVANVNCPSNARDQSACCANRPDAPDVIFANGGFTASGGHPTMVYMAIHRGMLRQSPDTFLQANDDNTFYRIDAPADLGPKWEKFIATKPDLVKTYLLHSEEFAERKDDEKVAIKGLDPANLELIVEKARAAGLRVAAHVDTAHDFRTAVAAGVNWLVHMPPSAARSGYPLETWVLTEADAAEAARRGVMVTITCGLNKPGGRSSSGGGGSRELVEATRKLQAANVKLLKEAGVKLLFGSDDWNGPDAERDALHALGAFTPAEILRMWSMDTPCAIFPLRAIGSLDPGTEANLVVLEADPLASPANYARVRLVAKAGAVVAETPAHPR